MLRVRLWIILRAGLGVGLDAVLGAGLSTGL